jgi:hypothetical protein
MQLTWSSDDDERELGDDGGTRPESDAVSV